MDDFTNDETINVVKERMDLAQLRTRLEEWLTAQKDAWSITLVPPGDHQHFAINLYDGQETDYHVTLVDTDSPESLVTDIEGAVTAIEAALRNHALHNDAPFYDVHDMIIAMLRTAAADGQADVKLTIGYRGRLTRVAYYTGEF